MVSSSDRNLRVKNLSDKVKSGAGIQKRIHLRCCRRNSFEVERKRSSDHNPTALPRSYNCTEEAPPERGR